MREYSKVNMISNNVVPPNQGLSRRPHPTTTRQEENPSWPSTQRKIWEAINISASVSGSHQAEALTDDEMYLLVDAQVQRALQYVALFHNARSGTWGIGAGGTKEQLV